MARAYSLDLRRKVMSFITSGGRKREAARVFGVGEDTIYRWMRREKAGDLSPKKRTDFPQKMETQKLIEHVSKHPDHTLTEISEVLKIGRTAVFRWLKRLNITLKKRPRGIRNGTKKSVLSSRTT